MVTVAFDAAPLAGRRTGVGVAVAGMLHALDARPELDMIAYGLTTRGWAQLKRAVPPGVRLARAPMPAGALLKVWSRFETPPVEWWSGEVQVVHGTNFVVPPARNAARVVTVYDLTAVQFPEMCAPVSRQYPALIDRALRRGAWVHAPSQAVATGVTEAFGIASEKVRVVPLGVTPRTDIAPDEPELPGARKPYVLALGTTEPRKDLPSLVEAFDIIAGSHPELELVIAGPEGWGEPQVQRAISGAASRERISRLGWMDDAQADRLLAGASVFAYPSIYEGFGFPPLEAMSAGVPVVATTAGSLPEVLGEAALLTEPSDAAALADAIIRVIDDAGLRNSLVEAGRRRVLSYTWAECAAGLEALYKEAACG